MKTKNFPAKVNARRMIAWAHAKMGYELPQDFKNLREKLLSNSVARAIRTKKSRIRPT